MVQLYRIYLLAHLCYSQYGQNMVIIGFSMLLVSVVMHPTSMPSTRDRILGWNNDKYSTPTERCDWCVMCGDEIGERAKRARNYQGCTNLSWCGMCIYMYGGMSAIIVVHATYAIWVELGHCHYLYVPTVLNVVTTGNSMGTKYIIELNRVLGFDLASCLLYTALLL